jgi:hypothetical protein
MIIQKTKTIIKISGSRLWVLLKTVLFFIFGSVQFRPKDGFCAEKHCVADGCIHPYSTRWLKPTAKDSALNKCIA